MNPNFVLFFSTSLFFFLLTPNHIEYLFESRLQQQRCQVITAGASYLFHHLASVSLAQNLTTIHDPNGDIEKDTTAFRRYFKSAIRALLLFVHFITHFNVCFLSTKCKEKK